MKIYLESISRSLGEIRETQHHLMIAHRKAYVSKEQYEDLVGQYNECSRMLRAIYQTIETKT